MLSYADVLKKNVEGAHKAFRIATEENVSVEHTNKVEENEESDDDSYVEIQKKKEFKPKNKNTIKKKPRSEDFDPNFKDALNEAQKVFLKDFKLTADEVTNISSSIQHVMNWEGYFKKIEFENDEIKFELLDKEYSFSKKRFLTNKYFVNTVINEYKEACGNVYVRFLPSKSDNEVKIHIKAGR